MAPLLVFDDKYSMHYKMIVHSYPKELYVPTRKLLKNTRYTYSNFLFDDDLVCELRVYSVSKRKIVALDLLYSSVLIHSVVISDTSMHKIIGW